MTLQASGAISMLNIANELGIAQIGINLNDQRLRDLAVSYPLPPAPASTSGQQISLGAFYNDTKPAAFAAVGVNDDQITDGNFFGSQGAGGTATTYPSVTPSGGTAPYTYLWAFTTSGGALLTSSTSQTAQVYKSYSANTNSSFTSTLQCTVKDATLATIVVTGIIASAQWTSSQIP